MCRTIHALLTVVICGIQMLVRVFMTLILMIENVIRMFLQTLYNFISFLLQLISLIPICCVFFATSRLKCFMCGGGGPCPVRRGGGCDCFMSAVAIIILFLIFRATGVLDKIFYSIGYAKAPKLGPATYSPATISDKECTREMINITGNFSNISNDQQMGEDDDWVEMTTLGDNLNDELIIESEKATTITSVRGEDQTLTESEEMEKINDDGSNLAITDANNNLESTNVDPSETTTLKESTNVDPLEITTTLKESTNVDSLEITTTLKESTNVDPLEITTHNIITTSTISESTVESDREDIKPDDDTTMTIIDQSKTDGTTLTISKKQSKDDADDERRHHDNVSKLRQWLESSPIAYYMV